MWRLLVVYETDKRYLIPFEVVEKFVDKATLQKIKTEALKEVQKL